MLAAPARRIRIDDSRRAGSAPGPVIARDRPEVAGLGLAAPGIEHRYRRLIDSQFGGREEICLEPLVERHQLRGRIADPEGERRAIKLDALGGQHFVLAIERQVPAVFGHQHGGDDGFGRQAGCSGAGASTIRSHARQANLHRCVTITRYWAGITSSRSEVSSPITCIGLLQHGQFVSAGATVS